MGFILKGNICYSKSPQELETVENGYLVCENGAVKGAFPAFTAVPERYGAFRVDDYGDCVIIPGLCDLHIHAPQFAFRGLGMDLELLDWLNTYTFPEESKYAEIDYANTAYGYFVDELRRGATTRACVFATLHTQATVLLMEKLERSGLATYVGKVNMDRNCPDYLRSESAEAAYLSTRIWIERTKGRFRNTKPIITPRFIPTCSDELMGKLQGLQKEHGLPVQSHLSENRGEIEWVRELCPEASSYGEAYDRFGLFGGEGVPTVMAHCVWSEGAEEELLRDNGVYVAHCPQSNTNLASGIAPIRRFLKKGIRVGLGTDVAGGCHASMFRAISDAEQASKLYWRLVDQDDAPLTMTEAFYLGTEGGGSFFGKVGSFREGYEFDAIVVDDSGIATSNPLKVKERLARIVHLSDDRNIVAKYVRGKRVK